MGIRKTQYQGGSIASFVVIAIVASILLIGGAAWLRHRGESAREVAVTSEEQGTEQSTGADSDEVAETSGDSQPASEEESIFGESSTSTSSESSAPADTDSDPVPGGSSESATPAATESADASSPNNLPQSGPAEVMASMVVMAAVTYAAVSYVLSRRELAQSPYESSL